MSLRDDMEYIALRGGLGLLRALPAAWGRRALGAAAALARRLPAARSRVVGEQLAAVYPESDPAELAALRRAVYDHLEDMLAELVLEPAPAADQVRAEPGWERLDELVADGRGVILASAHVGNFELGGRAIALRCRLLDVVKPQRNARFDTFLNGMRRRHGIAVVEPDRAAPAVVAHLRSGGVVSLLQDQDAGAQGVLAPFLGRPASVWTGAARFALATGCPVLPVGMLRHQDGRHVLHIGEPVAPGPDRDAGRYAARISLAVEQIIRRDPAQWFWVHRRWKGAQAAAAARRRDGHDQPVPHA